MRIRGTDPAGQGSVGRRCRVRIAALAALGWFVAVCLGADKNGVGPNVISLPKGPGSIEGLGESFQPSLNTGTARYGIGIRLPPGVAGHSPRLALSYDGGGGNGILGFGWQLRLPGIQRRSDKGIPNYGADVGVARADVFVTDSREELVPQADGYFFCRNEGAFERYRFLPEPADPRRGHWESTSPDGTRHFYGVSASARIEEPATGRIFSWLLERQIDTHGNVIEYAYRSFPTDGNLNQKYLATVRYGPGAPPWRAYHFVAFQYEDRSDGFEDGRAGFLVRTGKRLKTIVVGTQGAPLPGHRSGDFDEDGNPDALNRRYELDYLRYAGAASHWSLLDSVTLVGADGTTTLPPARHRYTVCDPPAVLSARDHRLATVDEPAAVMDNALVELIDLNADGLPDMLRTQPEGGSHTAWINRGPRRQPDGSTAVVWAPPAPVDPGSGAAWNFDLASDQTHLADMDGDGLADLVRKGNDDSVFYFRNQGTLSWGERQEMAVQDSSPPAPFGRDSIRLADIDFDKRSDIIQSVTVGGGVLYRIWFNTGHQTYSRARIVSPASGLDFETPGVQFADLNGDRVPDLCRILPATLQFHAGLGYGEFAPVRVIPLPDLVLDDVQLRSARLIDINGDGLADLVLERAAANECWYWLNLGNDSFSGRKRIVDLPSLSSPSAAVRWADLNGNGTADLIYADSQAVPRIQAVDIGDLINCGAVPNTLVEIDNGIGRVTRIEYAPSTRFALEDAAAGQPWPDPLPFPVTVVAGVIVSDSLGHEYVSRFRYHDGYYDPVEKQFRGFARAEQVDIGDTTAPTLVSRSFFDTGRAFEPMKGRLLRAILEQEDGRVFTDETTTWVLPPRTLMVGTNGEPVLYVHPVSSVKHVLELGRGQPRRVATTLAYDQYGNQTLEVSHGILEESAQAAFDDERIARTEFAINTNAWILRTPRRHTIEDEHGRIVARTESFYDDESFSGTNSGVVNLGNLTLVRTWVNPTNDNAFIRSTRTRYDVYGNPIALFDPLSDGVGAQGDGHFRETAYDPLFHTFAIREVLHVGGGQADLTFDATHDEGLATLKSATDFNGHTTHYSYDGLGRLASVVKPGDSDGFPTVEYEYVPGLRVPLRPGTQGGPESGVVNYVETRQRDTTEVLEPKSRMYLHARTYTDGLGRTLQSRSEAGADPGGNSPRVSVSGATLFNQRRQASVLLSSFFTQRTGPLADLLAFEDIESPAWRGLFHENGSLVPLDLASAHRVTTDYDATTRAVQTTNPDGSITRTIFEPLITWTYDENDTDPESPFFDTPSVQQSDGLGRLIRVDERVRLQDDGNPAASLQTWTTRYEYDLNDCLTRITDSQGNVKEMHYDGLAREVSLDDPNLGVSTRRYDDASNLIETVDARSQRITYAYDGLNRRLSQDFHDEDARDFAYRRTPDVVYHYDVPYPNLDQGDGTVATARNTRGLLSYVEDATGEEHRSFDARGRPEWTLKRVTDPGLAPTLAPHPNALVSYRTAFEYDSMDRIVRRVYPDNDVVGYRYGERGFLDGIVGGAAGPIVSHTEYAPSAQLVRLHFGNGTRTSRSYDRRGRLIRLQTASGPGNGGGDGLLIDYQYHFDAASNIREIRDQRPAPDGRRNDQIFAYDDLYRLIRAQYNPGQSPQDVATQILYRYDRLGNLLVQNSNLASPAGLPTSPDLGTLSYGGPRGRFDRRGRQPGDPPGPHALSAIENPRAAPQRREFSYDANGNLRQSGDLRFTWDFLDRLVVAEDGSLRAEYRYDFNGRRILKRVTPLEPVTGRATSVALYPDAHFEVRHHDQPTKYVFHGDSRVARIVGSLSTHPRIQRLRLRTGWNLISLAVTADDLTGQLRRAVGGQGPTIREIYRWNPQTRSHDVVEPGQPVAAGSVLWLRSITNTTWAVVGIHADALPERIPAGGIYIGSAGLEARRITGDGAGIDAAVDLSFFDASRQRWEHRRLAVPLEDPELPSLLAPGGAVFARPEVPMDLSVPDPTLRVRYYHEDHLGSATVRTDTRGLLVSEMAFLPFGAVRSESTPRKDEEFYGFIARERDPESGLHYCSARYLMSDLARFASPDPMTAHPETLSEGDLASFLANPQRGNPYGYARGNPVRFVDPSGFWDLEYGSDGTQTINSEVIKAFGDPEVERLGEAYKKAAAFLPEMALEGIGAIIGINTANAPGFNPDGSAVKTYPSLTYGDHAKNIILAVGGGKLAKQGWELLGKSLAAQSAKVGAGASRKGAQALESGIDPLADTIPVKNAGTQVSIAPAAPKGAAPKFVRSPDFDAWYDIYRPIRDSMEGMVRAGIPAHKVNNLAFQRADWAYVSKYNKVPPGNGPLPGD